MVHALKRKKSALRLLLAGTAALALSGCADSGRLDDPFGSPFRSSARYDRAPTGTINAPPEQKGDFFSETFKTFDNSAPSRESSSRESPSRDSTANLRPIDPPRRIEPLPVQSRPLPPAPIESSPLPAPSASSPAPSYSTRLPPAPVQAATAAPRSIPARVGGWSIEGGAPVVLAEGESAGMIADRYGVPVATLLQLNGYRAASQVRPGARLTIPVYSASHAAEAQPQREARAEAPARAQALKPAPKVQEEVAEAPKKAEPRFALKAGPKSLVEEENATPAVKTKVDLAQADVVKNDAAKSSPAADRKANLAQARAAAIQEAAAQIEKKKVEASKAQKLADKAQAKLQQQQQAQAAPPAPVQTKPAAPVQTKPALAPKMAQAAQEPAKFEPAKFEIAKAEPAKPEPAKPAPAKQQVAPAPDDDATARTTPPGDSASPEFRWPARGRVIQAYGNSGNDGINIAVPEGTAVKAAESGVVTYAGSELKGYGNLVLIHHPNGFDTVYANNGALNVKRGDTVKRGQTIAMSGQSGNVSSPQLHFELRKGHKPVDPTGFLAGL